MKVPAFRAASRAATRTSLVTAMTLALGGATAIAQPQPSEPRQPGVEVATTGDEGYSAEVFFEFDSAEPLAANEARLEQLAEWAATTPGTILLEGHTDPIGTEPYNVGLSARRAEAVRSKLIELGVAPERIVLGMYGEDAPRRTSFAEDRRVTASLTAQPLYEIVDQELEGPATALTWTEPVTLAELEGPEHPEVIATR